MKISLSKNVCVGLSVASLAAGAAITGCSTSETNNGVPNVDAGTSNGGGTNPGAGGGTSHGGAGGSTTGTGGGGTSGGAGGGLADAGNGADAGPGADATVRIVHASADAPSVDLYLKGSTTPLVTALEYGNASGYLNVAPGVYEIEARMTGASATAAPAFTTTAITFAAGKKYTAVAAGDLASSSATDAFRILPLEETFAASAAGTGRIRVVHAGIDAPPVGIDLNADNAAAPDVPSVARFGDSGGDGIAVSSSNKSSQIGVDASGAAVTAFTIPAVPDQGEVFVIATGLLGKLPREADGFALLEVMADSQTRFVLQNPRVHAMVVSSDVPNVDAYFGPIEILDNTAFGSLAEFQVPPNTYTVDVFAGQAGATPRPTTTPLASVVLPAFAAGQEYLVVGAGVLTVLPSTFQVLAIPEAFDLTDATHARLRAVHASDAAPAIDMGNVAVPGTLVTPPVFPNLAFGQVSAAAGSPVSAGSLTLGIAATGLTTTLAEFAVATTAGERAFVIAGGNTGDVAHPLQLFTVKTGAAAWVSASIPAN